MRYREWDPAPALRGVARRYWAYEKEESETALERDVLMPERESSLAFQTAGCWIRADSGLPYPPVIARGAALAAEEARLPGACAAAGVKFAPGGSIALGLFVPAAARSCQPFGGDWADGVLHRLRSGRFDEVPKILDQALLGRAAETGCPADSEWAAVDDLLARRTGRADLDELVRAYGRSARQFERASALATGYSPRDYRALLRCEFARGALFRDPAVNLSDLACALGFFDLPHFCRTFKRWCSLTPAEYARYCGPFRKALGSAGGGWRIAELGMMLG